jgi:REP element-mobilizing transposase RayT
MPNHVHGIVVIKDSDKNESPDQSAQPSGAPTLGIIVGAYKSAVARQLRSALLIGPVWQRNYYEHVIRNEADLDPVRQYIRDNPVRWDDDPYFMP